MAMNDESSEKLENIGKPENAENSKDSEDLKDSENESGEFSGEKGRAEKIEELVKKAARKKNNNVGKALSLITQMGLQVAVCVGGSVMLGLFLDRRFETAPLFIIIFAFLGPAAAVKMIFDIAKDWDD